MFCCSAPELDPDPEEALPEPELPDVDPPEVDPLDVEPPEDVPPVDDPLGWVSPELDPPVWVCLRSEKIYMTHARLIFFFNFFRL